MNKTRGTRRSPVVFSFMKFLVFCYKETKKEKTTGVLLARSGAAEERDFLSRNDIP